MASNLKQIKIRNSVYEQLDNLKRDDESYSIAIQKIMDDNANLKAMNEELRHDKHLLMKIAMKTEDSIAFPNIAHSVIFALCHVLEDKGISDEDKFICLKTYLRPSLNEDYEAVLSSLSSFEEDFEIESPIIQRVYSWIQDKYDLKEDLK